MSRITQDIFNFGKVRFPQDNLLISAEKLLTRKHNFGIRVEQPVTLVPRGLGAADQS